MPASFPLRKAGELMNRSFWPALSSHTRGVEDMISFIVGCVGAVMIIAGTAGLRIAVRRLNE